MLWLDGQEAGVLGAFCMFACPTLLGILRFYRILSKEGVEYSFLLGDPSPLRPVRILSFYFDFPHSLSNLGENSQANRLENL